MGIRFYEGTMNERQFLEYLEHELGPKLRPGDILVMDNYSVHKTLRVQKAIESYGASIFYLPPYSPEYNPIEQVWSYLKGKLRRLGLDSWKELKEKAYSLWEAVEQLTLTKWIQHCGWKIST